MQNLILILQIISGISLSALVFVQVKGTGFGRVWGFSNNFSRRGLEGLVFKFTFFVAFVFLVVSIAAILV